MVSKKGRQGVEGWGKKEGGITNKLYESRREPRARETAAEEEEDRQLIGCYAGPHDKLLLIARQRPLFFFFCLFPPPDFSVATLFHT